MFGWDDEEDKATEMPKYLDYAKQEKEKLLKFMEDDEFMFKFRELLFRDLYISTNHCDPWDSGKGPKIAIKSHTEERDLRWGSVPKCIVKES